MGLRIAITGPESTGKSTLTRELAEHFKSSYTTEYSREYLETLNRPYNFDDILKIAKGQYIRNTKASETNGLLFLDTELLVTWVWCKFKYKKTHKWIKENIDKQGVDLFLLAAVDLQWQPDPLREHPDKRDEIFNLYESELKKFELPYVVISGIGENRLMNAVKEVENLRSRK